jgi:hypothetical protein
MTCLQIAARHARTSTGDLRVSDDAALVDDDIDLPVGWLVAPPWSTS